MKITHVFILCLGLAACTKTPQQTAEANIEAYMKKSLDDPASYSPISFGPLDSVQTTFEDIEGYSMIKSEVEYGFEETDFLVEGSYEEYKAKKAAGYFEHKKDSLINVLKKMEAGFKPTFKRFDCVHDFRAKNKMGAIVKEQVLVRLAPDLTIISVRK